MGNPISQAGQSAAGQQQWGACCKGPLLCRLPLGQDRPPNPQFCSVLIIQQARVLHDEHSTWKSHCYSNTLHREHFLNIIATDIRCSTMAISGGMVSICIYKGFIYVQSHHFSNRDMLVHSSQDVNKHI